VLVSGSVRFISAVKLRERGIDIDKTPPGRLRRGRDMPAPNKADGWAESLIRLARFRGRFLEKRTRLGVQAVGDTNQRSLHAQMGGDLHLKLRSFLALSRPVEGRHSQRFKFLLKHPERRWLKDVDRRAALRAHPRTLDHPRRALPGPTIQWSRTSRVTTDPAATGTAAMDQGHLHNIPRQSIHGCKADPMSKSQRIGAQDQWSHQFPVSTL